MKLRINILMTLALVCIISASCSYFGAIKGNGSTNTGNDGIESLQLLPLVMDLRVVGGDIHVTAQRVDHPDLVVAVARALDGPAVARLIEFGPSGG